MIICHDCLRKYAVLCLPAGNISKRYDRWNVRQRKMIVVNREPVKGKVLEPESEKNRIPSGKGTLFLSGIW